MKSVYLNIYDNNDNTRVDRYVNGGQREREGGKNNGVIYLLLFIINNFTRVGRMSTRSSNVTHIYLRIYIVYKIFSLSNIMMKMQARRKLLFSSLLSVPHLILIIGLLLLLPLPVLLCAKK